MKKPRSRKADPDLKPHYDFTKGVRGKYAGRFRADAPVTLVPEESKSKVVAKVVAAPHDRAAPRFPLEDVAGGRKPRQRAS